MELKRLRILPAALALSMMMVPVAIAGSEKAVNDTGDESPSYERPHHPDYSKPPTPPEKTPTPTPTPPSPPSPPTSGGGGSSNDPTIACRIGNRLVYTANWRQCKQLKYSLGYGQGHGGGSVVVDGGYETGGGYVYGGGGYATGGGYGRYQQQRIIRYVARPSRAAQMQAEKRARRAARRASAAYGYADGGMVGYGNGVMIGGYGNNVVINGNVYAGQQIIVKKKRKGKRARRVIYQQPIYDNGYGYDYQGPEMYKGGGY